MSRATRGFTLIEVMVAMAVLLVGMLGLMRLQILGLTWNESARAHSRATELALELRSAMEQVPWGDGHLAVTGTWGSTAPAPYGSLLLGPDGSVAPGATAWNDASPILGVTPDASLERDSLNPAQPRFQRRWTVWGYTNMASTNSGALIVANSVIWRDRGSMQAREVVVYTMRANPAAVLSSIRVSG